MKSVKLNNLLVVIFNGHDLNKSYVYNTLESLYNETEEHSMFILDLSNIKHLNEDAAGALISFQNYLKDRKKSLRMYETKEQLVDVYAKLNLENVMSMAYRTNSDQKDDNMIFYFNS